MAIIEQVVDPITQLPLLEKNVAESKRFIFNAEPELIDGDTVASVTSITATPQEGLDNSDALTIGIAIVSQDGYKVLFFISGGIVGERYLVKALLITGDGETIQLEGILIVKD